MIADPIELLRRFLWIFPAILFSLTIHEYAHGWTALRCGDGTAKNAGRLTLNPFAHLDLFGLLMMIFGPFGWAKPVPVNFYNLNKPKRDMVFVALAGPAVNIVCAIVAGICFRVLFPLFVPSAVVHYLGIQLLLVVYFGIGLSFFNLLPVPPLDGSNIVIGLLPQHLIMNYVAAVRYVPMIFLALLILQWSPLHIPVFSWIIDPLWKPYNALWQILIFGRKDFINAFL
jgi:Zn-dependent protease